MQLEEVKRLIEVGRVPQLRLAHILLDSAVELIMHCMVEAELESDCFLFGQLEVGLSAPGADNGCVIRHALSCVRTGVSVSPSALLRFR